MVYNKYPQISPKPGAIYSPGSLCDCMREIWKYVGNMRDETKLREKSALHKSNSIKLNLTLKFQTWTPTLQGARWLSVESATKVYHTFQYLFLLIFLDLKPMLTMTISGMDKNYSLFILVSRSIIY